MCQKYTRSMHLLTLLAAIGGTSAARAQAGDEAYAGDAGSAQRPFVFGLSAGSTWSDNINLAPADENDGTIGHLGVELQMSRESRRLRTDLDLNAAYEHYFDNNFDDGVIGGFDGSAVLGIVPERFEWFFQDNFGQIRRSAFAASTPDNRENFNYFTTGPDFTLRFGQATSLRLSGRYSSNNYENVELDGDRYSANVALIRRLSTASALSLNAEKERYQYDDPVRNNEYDRNDAYLGYQLENRRTRFGLDLGVTQIDDDGDKSDGELVRLSLRRQVSAATSVVLGGGSEFTEAGDAFRAAQSLYGVSQDTELTLATADAFQRRYGYAGWAFDRNRTSFGLNAEYSREEYETITALDRSVSRYAVHAQRQMTPAMRLRLEIRYDDEDYKSLAAKIEELRGIASFDMTLGRTLAWRVQYDYRDRSGSGSGATQYKENQVSLYVSWFPLGRSSGPMATASR